MEHLVEGLSATVFRGRVHPVELADRLVRHVDREAGTGAGPIAIANMYTIRVNPTELPSAVDPADLNTELELVVTATAAERGWRLGGPASVAVVADGNVGHGRIEIDGQSRPGPLPAWSQLIDPRAGRVFDLTENWCSIGRAPGSDVELPEPRVSRSHATIFRRHGTVWVVDVGSSNGTFVNDAVTSAEASVIVTGDAVRFGPATFTFKMLQ